MAYRLSCPEVCGIFVDQGLNCCPLHCKAVSYLLNHKESPNIYFIITIQFSSVAQSCLTLCDPIDCSTPASMPFTISRSMLKPMSIELVMPSNISPSVVPFSSLLQSFPPSGFFPVSQFFASGGQSIGVSASPSVLPMNIQD